MVSQLTLSDTILEQMAEEDRVVLSPWRAAVYIRRATYVLPEERRRWHQFPTESSNVQAALAQMRARSTITSIAGHNGLSRVSIPFARSLPLDERELLFEIHPYAALTHISALEYHGLTLDQPRVFTITVPSDSRGDLLPLGTRTEDWDDAVLPPGTIPHRVNGFPVITKRIKAAHFFGLVEVMPLGVPLRYTGIERTLIDAIQSPDLCGGVESVLTAWREAVERIDLSALVQQVDRLGIGILRQRVGYLLQELGLSHPRLDQWKRQSVRGGSSRLVAARSFSPVHDPRWNLSINVPVSILHE